MDLPTKLEIKLIDLNNIIRMNSVSTSRPRTAITHSRRLNINNEDANHNAPPTNLCKISSNIHSCIFKFLSSRDLFNVSHVCHSLRTSANQNHVWRRFLGEMADKDVTETNTKLCYLVQQSTLKNFLKPRSINTRLLGHKKMITSIAIEGDGILTGSKDCYAKYWNMQRKETYSFEHSNIVTDVMFFGGNLITGSADHTVRIWSQDTGGN